MKQYRTHLFVACTLAVVLLTGMNNVLQNALIDLRFNWFPRQASGDVVVIGIDPRSIETVGVWPWPRTIHAELIGKLERAGAKDIAFDIDFSSPSNPAFDDIFSDALKKAGGSVVLPSFMQFTGAPRKPKTIHVNHPLTQFRNHAWPAVVNVAVEPDGLVRRYPFGEILDGTFLPSMGAILAGAYQQKQGSLWIDFSIRAETVPAISYVDILRDDPKATEQVRNRKVLVGGTAVELGDRFNVPNGRVIPGVMLQALAAESILQDRLLRPASSIVPLCGVGLLALLMLMMWRSSPARRRLVVLAGFAIGAEFAAMYVQARWPIVLDASLLHVAVAAYIVAMALDEIDFRDLLGSIAEKRFKRIAMSLGDGLVCADHNGLITIWNPGAMAIFGPQSEEMIGQPFDTILSDAPEARGPRFSILGLGHDDLHTTGGKVLELTGRRRDGETFPLEACFSGWQGADGFHYGVILRDISVRKREEETLRYLAEYDTLTGLANRNTLRARLREKIEDAKTDRSDVALLVIGIEKFQQINDMLGHAYGDRVLCSVARRLSSLADRTHIIARLSGDEFAIIVSGPDAAKTAEGLAERTSSSFSKDSLSVGAREHRIKVSVGVAAYPRDCATAEELLGNSHLALYRAKSTKRSGYVLFESGIRDQLEKRLTLEAELSLAVDRNEFELFYQPQVNLRDGSLTGAEALIRWRHPDRGLVSPADFMPVVNCSPISDDIAAWVMETACRQGRLWQDNGHDLRVSINLAPSQLQGNDLAAKIKDVLARTGFSPARLGLEVTEDILLLNDNTALEIFRDIQDLGIQIAFDDFGTGYGSLSYLKKFPLDTLKIDRSFVMQLHADSDDAAIVGSTISLGKKLGLSVIAEGIENHATADLLASMGCEEGQGYYFGKPVPAAEFEQRFLSGGNTAASEQQAATAA